MSTFNPSENELFVIGCHGCSPSTLKSAEDSTDYPESRFFIVPENIMVVYLTANGVQSIGSKNIPFIKNLHDYNPEMFNYVFNPANYQINMDKTNPESYRHQDFFKSLPFFSDFNYLCNFELYPAGVPCPYVNLSFTLPGSTIKPSYFEGITPLNNITYSNYGQTLGIIDPANLYNPASELSRTGGFIYTGDFINLLKKSYGLDKGIFFISACRADFFTNNLTSNVEIVGIHPIDRNCGDIDYDIAFVDNMIREYPTSVSSLENVKRRLIVRDRRKKDIDAIIFSTYVQSSSFYPKNFILELYKLLLINIRDVRQINLCVNFKKIIIEYADFEESEESEESTELNYLLQLVDKIFFLIRDNLRFTKRDPERNQIIENNNVGLYEKLGYVYRFVFVYIRKNRALPSWDIFREFCEFVERVYNPSQTRTEITGIVNQYTNPNYGINLGGNGFDNPNTNIITNIITNNEHNHYKKKYLKYKEKYLELKNSQLKIK